MKRSRLRDAFCTLLLMVALKNLPYEIFSLNGDHWQQAAFTVNLNEK
jgi:hypothetical protein